MVSATAVGLNNYPRLVRGVESQGYPVGMRLPFGEAVWGRTGDLLVELSEVGMVYVLTGVPSDSSTTAGSFIVNVDPLPASLSTSTVPPIISQKWRVSF